MASIWYSRRERELGLFYMDEEDLGDLTAAIHCIKEGWCKRGAQNNLKAAQWKDERQYS